MTNKTLFKWAGSKRRVYPKFEPFFYPTQGFNTFIDSFCGSAFMAKKVKEKHPNIKVVINDLNTELITLYRNLANNYNSLMVYYDGYVDRFVNQPQDHDIRKVFYYEVRERYCLDRGSKDPVELSAMLLFMLKINFNGIWKAYKKMGRFYSTPPGANLDRYKIDFFYSTPHKEYSEFLRGCDIFNLPYDQIDINSYGNPYVYLDPPYRDCSINYDNKGDLITGDVAQEKIITHHMGHNCLFSFSNKERDDNFFTNICKEKGLNYHYVNLLHTATRSSKDGSKPMVKEILVKNFS